MGEPARTNPFTHPASVHSGGGGGGGVVRLALFVSVSIRTTPVTAAPRGTGGESPSGATPPAVHPRRRAPSPTGPARASTALDASLGTHDARTRARVHPPGSCSSSPSPSRPRRTWTSTPGARGDASGAMKRGRSSRASSSRAARNGRKGASGAMKRSRSSSAAGGPSRRVDARVGILSAVADIATMGAPSAPGRRSSSGR
mmetsp:Transcript_11457/g.51886  ORF Transcript_11457/g.51886 Transcript_11457/m.51886 type:complete len:201 (-) Transcript_11457:179-781(-)